VLAIPVPTISTLPTEMPRADAENTVIAEATPDPTTAAVPTASIISMPTPEH